MTPAPSTQHQKIVTTLIALFYNALKDSPCQAIAPFAKKPDVMQLSGFSPIFTKTCKPALIKNF